MLVHEVYCVVLDLSFVSGLEIWCIESLRVVLVPKSSHGKFYSGSAYIVLNVSFSRFALFT